MTSNTRTAHGNCIFYPFIIYFENDKSAYKQIYNTLIIYKAKCPESFWAMLSIDDVYRLLAEMLNNDKRVA